MLSVTLQNAADSSLHTIHVHPEIRFSPPLINIPPHMEPIYGFEDRHSLEMRLMYSQWMDIKHNFGFCILSPHGYNLRVHGTRAYARHCRL